MEKKHKRIHNKPKILSLVILGNLTLMLILTIFSFYYFYNNLAHAGITSKNSYEPYEKHYAFITANREPDFWTEVYEGAQNKGKEQHIYVERFGNKLFTNYNKVELLRMAIDAGVDGIILVGDGENETKELIDEAAGKDIPVITVLKDSNSSMRQSFVGLNNYNLGQEYGKQVLELYNEDTKRIYVLVDENSLDSSQNLILLGIRETIEKKLGKNHSLEIKAEVVNNEDAFSPDETIRDIIMDSGNLPDIMICLNATYTECAYQAVVDHNKVGKINIIGYYDSDNIISAIEKGIIHSSISVDTNQLGSLCVEALDEYLQTGHVSDYLSVNTKLINSNNVSAYIKDLTTED